MKYLSSIVLVLLLVCGASAQLDPPSGLDATLYPGGAVDLTWNVPSAGLNEDFSDGIGQGFNWLTTGGVFSIDGGYAKMDMTNATNWGTGAYEDMEFGSFFLETNFQIVGGSTSSRGHMWCTNGPRDADFNGYGMYCSGGSYSVWEYTAGSASNVIPWTANGAINQGDGAVNNFQCDGSGGTYDLYINGTYINSFFDTTYPQGYAGLIIAYGANCWFDDIMCMVTAAASVPQTPADPGVVDSGYFDDMHNPIDAPMPTSDAIVFDRFGAPETDEFINYRVYRDGNLIGTSTTEDYTDQLPSPGLYSYEVTAYYDEGESTPAGPVLVDWVAVVLDLTGTTTTVPETGGDIVYDAHLLSMIGLAMNNLQYQTFITLPNGQVVGPTISIPWNLTPFMDYTVTGMTQYIPDYAPEGNYDFEGRAGVMANPALQVSDNFPFAKVGAGLMEDFEDGLAQGFNFYVGGGSYMIDGGYCKFDQVSAADWGSGVYEDMSFGNFTLSSTHEMIVTQGYSVGLLWRGNGPQDADYAGYAVYISNGSFSAWVYTAGAPTNLVGWTSDPAINQGTGAINDLEIIANGNTFDFYANGSYVSSWSDGTYTDGYVGIVACYTNETWFDDVICVGGAAPALSMNANPGELESVLRDHMGVVITDAADYYTPGVGFDRSNEFVANEIDFIPEDWVASGSFITGEEAGVVALPTEFEMQTAYPNPFNPSTSVAIALPNASDLTVTVFNVMGQQVATLANGQYTAGQHNFVFDAANLASGLYFIQAQVPGELNAIQKITLMK